MGEGGHREGTAQIFLYLCSTNLVSRNTNRQISEKRISDQARSTRRIFVHSETKGANNRYFGGPILDKSARKWRQTHYIRACEETPSDEERELVRKNGLTFDVESEVCSQVLSLHSPKVQLLEFSAKDDIGIYELQDNYPSRSTWMNLEWLIERDDVYRLDLKARRKVACVAYNGKVTEEDTRDIRDEAARQLQESAFSVSLC